VNCTGCQHIDRRNGECLELVPQVLCAQCQRLFLIGDIRCPRCHVASTTVVSVLDRHDGDLVASKYCPLTDGERKRLKAKQNAPKVVPVTQKELF
jgi:hypothetical protein